MDPITAAIVAALTAGVTSAAGEVGKQAIVEGYNALVGAIKQKFGADSKIADAVDDIEKEPDFKPNQEALAGRVAQVNAAEDPELKDLAQALLEQIRAQPGGEQMVQTATGHHITQAAHDGIAVTGDGAKIEVTRQEAGDGAMQIGRARDVSIDRDE